MNDQTQEKQEKNKLIVDAQTILESRNNKPKDILSLAKKLHEHDEFSWAKKILDQAVSQVINDSQLKQQINQKRALSTYKDTHLNREKALDQALEILKQELDLENSKNPETLGIAGAIYKRKWELNGIKVHLEQALIYYNRGYAEGVESDDAYNAINAAYILDLLAYLEQKQIGKLGASSSLVATRHEDAEQIRKKIIAFLNDHLSDQQLGKQTYWPIATLAEAYFGIQKFADAKKWLNKILTIPDLPEWQYVTTAKQLVHLAQLQADIDISDEQLENTEAWKVLEEFLGDKASALRSLYRGKMGLALSGGGFRASFYHIGVLAKLAELDLLRHVEVISCVSGGSILGTHYYLELRRLFNVEKKKDGKIDRDDYVQLVKNLADDFLTGVQENPRVRLLANPWNNLKMIFAANYSRTQRLGELYEQSIYSRVKDGEGNQKRWLNSLYIYPDGNKEFLPRRDNWSRQCKIPELVLNATTLNTGHNWQFTASWMGESPTQIDSDVDTNDRYRRTYYRDAPEPHNKMRLGTAVGASSCVPGLFEPIILRGLYQDTTLRLVDGGIYDNQGVSGLIEQDCNIIISSDAAGQMNTKKDPGGGVMDPLLRANKTLMQRVRNSQYRDLKARKITGVLKGFAYAHLKQGLEGENADWVGSKELSESQPPSNIKTKYGIRKDIQGLLAGIRTDLDSFSDIEAYALMTSGYCAIESSVQESLQGFPLHQGAKPEWKFLKVESAMKQDEASGEAFARLKANLEVAPKRFGKIWILDKNLNTLIKGLGGLLLLVLAYIWYSNPDWQPFGVVLSWLANKLTIGMIMSGIAILLIVGISSNLLGPKQANLLEQALDFRDLPRRVLIGAGIGLVGWIGAFIHLRFFDKMFKSFGKIE